MSQPALLFVILFPFVGAVVTAFIRQPQVARTFALLVSFITFVAAVLVAFSTLDAAATYGMDGANWLSVSGIGFGFKLACDGINMWLMLLTAALTPLVILSTGTHREADQNIRWMYVWIQVLLGAILGTFLAADGLLFYFFFELTLVPTTLMIAIWGGPDRRAAAARFFIYTFAGSIFMLIGLIYLGRVAGTFEITALVATAQNGTLISSTERFWLALAFLIGFLVKTPVFPLNTWQPLTYAQSPTAAAVLLAAVMSKLGTYGLLRLTLPIGFVGTHTNDTLLHILIGLCLVSIIYGGLIAWVQTDMAKIMAYSSLSHLGLCVLAMLGLSTLSLQGALVYMIAHTLSTAGLFLIVGMIQRRTGTRDITHIGGIFKPMPVLSTLLVGFTMASIGLPITAGFVGEFLSLQGVMNTLGIGTAIIAATGIVLGAIYMLNMVAKVGFGPLKLPQAAQSHDVTRREFVCLVPIMGAILLVGIQPTLMLNSFKTDVQAIHSPAPQPMPVDTSPMTTESDVFDNK
jgi:NADH-quinone oxidoreductase subunit M